MAQLVYFPLAYLVSALTYPPRFPYACRPPSLPEKQVFPSCIVQFLDTGPVVFPACPTHVVSIFVGCVGSLHRRY